MNNSLHKVDFKAKQAEFTSYIRNPSSNPCPEGVRENRMQMYRELCFNNVESFLSSNFPVLRKICNNDYWQQLTQDFFANHPSTTPYFSEIPEEFIAYLQNQRKISADDYPFMLELAHYEWVEMALTISTEESPATEIHQITDLTQSINLSPLAWPLAYQFPVHKISPDYLHQQTPKQPSYLVAYRDTKDEVKFIELAPLSFCLLQTIQNQQPISIDLCLTTVLPDNPSELLKKSALEAIQQFIDKQVVLLV
ncbi:uncharacterized protein BJAS_P2432 [Bathymodiolus japonicus methanotrophic gill symbiont]|uniref:HvfC family RiPP maturation protein n=1 Tax=Bathymodiolus japonicus methanotrophic gill symbiont TaxID=113269 RepID=UPI001B529704|nr:putative DNA-binding domain-containing protein [Bathymodiolus japonicus methanotrophic gill symbiont]GFO72307.1 uncharacterized protein BJAS_P2432 [Bathymodiolus japonicus methanotrophic gill symbiont]